MLTKFAFCFLAILLCVVIPTSAQIRRSSRNIANRQKIVLVGTTWKIYQTINGTEEWGTYTFLADGKIAEDEQTRWRLVGNKLNIKEQYGDIDLVVNGDKMKGSGQLGMNPRPFPMMGTKIKDSSFMPDTNIPKPDNGKALSARKKLANKSWQPFWMQFSSAIYKKDFKTLEQLSSADFFDAGGDTPKFWFEVLMADRWNLVKKAVMSGTRPLEMDDRMEIERVTIKYGDMIFRFEKDNKWRFVGVMGD